MLATSLAIAIAQKNAVDQANAREKIKQAISSLQDDIKLMENNIDRLERDNERARQELQVGSLEAADRIRLNNAQIKRIKEQLERTRVDMARLQRALGQ
jgi:hypothetical protein